MDYKKVVNTLAKARHEMRQYKDALDTVLDEVKGSDLYLGAEKGHLEAKAEVERLENAIRLNVEADAHAGVKSDHAALGIRNTKVVIYNEEDAVQWAISKEFHNVLQVKKTPFTKLAKSLIEAGQEIPKVTVEVNPKATIKTDLTPWL